MELGGKLLVCKPCISHFACIGYSFPDLIL
jgi:hypothetical protein